MLLGTPIKEMVTKKSFSYTFSPFSGVRIIISESFGEGASMDICIGVSFSENSVG